MKKFLVVSGFLGAGKTTTMMALYHFLNRHKSMKAAMIANDLGAKDLVDTLFAKNCGCSVSELPGECICYQTENLVDRLRRLFDYEHNEFVMSDIPGCGVGALDHVYHKLTKEYPGEFELAPFMVVADPKRLRTIMPEEDDIGLPEEMKYLFRAQLREADVVVLNKTDLLTEQEQEETLSFLHDFCPDTPIFPICARKETGIAALAEYLLANTAQLKTVDIGYGGEEFVAAEGKLSWYNRQYYAKVCCNDFDGNAYLQDLAEEIRVRLQKIGRNVPHLKLFANMEDGDFAKISLTGVDEPIELDHAFSKKCVDLPVVINARATCEASVFSELVDDAMVETGRKYQLEIIVFFTECFGMMDQGRL